MARASKTADEYAKLKRDIKNGTPGKLYIFYGEERYLLEYYLGKLRDAVLNGGFEEFNSRRFDGKSLTMEALGDAVDTCPAFAGRTFIQVDDFDIFGAGESVKQELAEILSDLPDYVCLVFVYDTVAFKSDSRVKLNSRIRSLASVVEFKGQSQSDLTVWVTRHFKAQGKEISRADAEYLVFITDGLMTTLLMEIDKVCSYAAEKQVTRDDIDAVVVPVPDAAAYKLTDAVISGDYNSGVRLLGDLLMMQEAPQKLMYSIGAELRHLTMAKVLSENQKTVQDLMALGNIRMEFHAKKLMNSAKRVSMEWCIRSLELCAEAALSMNSTSDGKAVLSLLIIRLASERKGAVA